MRKNLLFPIYLINSILLITHEIDSAFWQEWKLINPLNKSGINGFLILHLPILFAVLLGLVLVYENKMAGKIISILLATGGLFAFFFHYYYIQQGRSEFNTYISKGLIISMFIISFFQVIVTIQQILKNKIHSHTTYDI